MAANKIWTNPANRPDDFEGRIVAAEVKPLEDDRNEEGNNSVDLKHKAEEKEMLLTNTESIESDKESDFSNRILETDKYNPSEPLGQDDTDTDTDTQDDAADLLAFLPSLNTNGVDNVNDDIVDTEIKTNKLESEKPKNTRIVAQTEVSPSVSIKSKATSAKRQVSFSVPVGLIEEHKEQVTLFFKWLQDGIQSGSLKTNQAKARVHTVDEGVILITPGIFQDFARSQENKDDASWMAIQQKVLKKNWHIRGNKGLNVVKYQVKGKSKQTTVNTILFQDVSKIFGLKEPPASNPHFTKVD